MANTYTHFILYAKNHYKRTNTFQDLQKIQGNWSGIPPECIAMIDVIEMLLIITHELGVMTTEYEFRDFVLSTNPHMYARLSDGPYNWYQAVMLSCLSKMRLMQVSCIPDGVGEPDPNILPLNRPYKNVLDF